MTHLLIAALQPLPPGQPGQHLGASHVAKHWLNPSEYWGDLAADLRVPEALRPASIAGTVAAAGEDMPQTINPHAPSPGLIAAWPALTDAVPAYMGVVHAAFDGSAAIFASSLSAPSPGPRQGIQLLHGRHKRPGRVAALLAGGVVVIGDLLETTESNDAPQPLCLRTAYRPPLHPGAQHGHGASNAQSRAIRRGLSEMAAKRSFLTLTQRSTL